MLLSERNRRRERLPTPTSCLSLNPTLGPEPPRLSSSTPTVSTSNDHIAFTTTTMSMLRTAFSTSARSAVASSSRSFHASAVSQKTATEKVAEVADKVRLAVA